MLYPAQDVDSFSSSLRSPPLYALYLCLPLLRFYHRLFQSFISKYYGSFSLYQIYHTMSMRPTCIFALTLADFEVSRYIGVSLFLCS